MLQIYFSFFNDERIYLFTSTFVDICSANSYPFGFPSRSKWPPLDIIKFLFTALRNQDKKFSLIQVDEDRALERSSGFMRTFHNMNIIVQNTGVYSYSLNGKSEISNNTLANIARAFLMDSIHKKVLWCLSYQYVIFILRQNENILCGYFLYFLLHGSIPEYKSLKIWVVIFYIANGLVTINNIDYRSHYVFSVGYASLQDILYI